MNNLYPYYLVKELDTGTGLFYAGNFLQGDTSNPAVKKTEFAAHTSNGLLKFHIRCSDPLMSGNEEVKLNFDPDH